MTENFSHLSDFNVPVDASLRHKEVGTARIGMYCNTGRQALRRHLAEIEPRVLIRVELYDVVMDLLLRLIVTATEHYEAPVGGYRVRV